MEPATFTRIDATRYVVGDRLYLVRIAADRWIAGPADGGQCLFEAGSLEEILELAHQAVEMFRPVN